MHILWIVAPITRKCICSYVHTYIYTYVDHQTVGYLVYLRSYKFNTCIHNVYTYDHPDINECEDEHGCSQICKNQIGSYTCECMDGFLLQADEKQCKGNGIMTIYCLDLFCFHVLSV